MSRQTRVDFSGAIHHVVNRGVQKTLIFRSQDEREFFLSLFDRFASDYGIDILAYCLMNNHFHLIVRSRDGRLSDWMQVHQFTYAKEFNERHELSGHLFQDRFFSELIQEGPYFHTAVAYVLTNPHRSKAAGPNTIVHPWTSTSELEDRPKRVDWPTLFDLLGNVQPDSFLDFLERGLSGVEKSIKEERRSVRDVHVLGNDAFLERCLEEAGEDTRRESTKREEISPNILLESICEEWDIEDTEKLLSTKGDHAHRRPRFASYYLLQARAHLSQREIGEMYGITPSAVSQGIQKAKDLKKEEKTNRFYERWDL